MKGTEQHCVHVQAGSHGTILIFSWFSLEVGLFIYLSPVMRKGILRCMLLQPTIICLDRFRIACMNVSSL